MRQVPVDSYVFETLLPDLVFHDRSPSSWIVYLYLWYRTRGVGQKAVSVSYRALAEGTGLSKTGVQAAVRRLRRRALIECRQSRPTAVPVYAVLRPWLRFERRG